jgi:hypothetical protein
MKIQVRNDPKGKRMFDVRKSQQSRNDFPNKLISTAPCESEQTIPMTTHIAVSIHAPYFRSICSSSKITAVPISCMDIVDVRAARARSA